MRLEFQAKTNKPYCMINTAKFLAYGEDEVIVDRDETNWSVAEDGHLSMEWRGVYVWEIEGRNVYEKSEDQPSEKEMKDMLENAIFLGFELEDDADADYTVTDVKWILS